MSLPMYQGLSLDTQVLRARDLARVAHAGQVDKIGERYILHPEAVAGRLLTIPAWHNLSVDGQKIAQAAAWLHDIIEDTPVDLIQLIDLGFPPRVVTTVSLLTEKVGQSRKDYLLGIKTDCTASAIKYADLWHNTHPDRMARLEVNDRHRMLLRYANSWEVLGVSHEAMRLRDEAKALRESMANA